MAKLATQELKFTISKAVPSSYEYGAIDVIDQDAIDQLIEAIAALSGDENLVVEYTGPMTEEIENDDE